jgi:UDP-N-acetylmuramoylalanine--D-glutamate ligase
MNAAVAKAASIADRGWTVLLAPAAASLDMFSNYAARGDAFVQAVRELAS